MAMRVRFLTLAGIAALAMDASIPLAWGAGRYYLATDVPATLGGTDFTPDQIVESANGGYAAIVGFTDPWLRLGGLERLADGRWLLTPDSPQPWAGPRDVALFDGATPTLYFDGAAAGIPEYARIDAVMTDAAGNLVLSFDVPVSLGGVEYGASDLVRHGAGGFSLFWDAAAAGVPDGSNVVGAGRDAAGRLIVTFDVPTFLGDIDHLPGTLVMFEDGTTVRPYIVDPLWPRQVQLRDFGLSPAAGAVPDGGAVPGVPLRVNLDSGNLALTWGASCAASDTDYEVYEGSLTSPFAYTHTRKLCTTGGATSTAFAPPAGNVYYLVVPKNAVSEGSYGRAGNGAEIPQGTVACLPQEIAVICP